MNWQERTTPHDLPATHAVDFLGCVLREAAHPLPSSDRRVPVRPAKVKCDNEGVTAVTGMPQPSFEHLATVMETWFGTPRRTENRIADDLLGANLVYPNRITLNYLATRDSGVSLHIPKSAENALVSQVETALRTLSERKSQSPVAR